MHGNGGSLFQYGIILHPTEEDAKNGKRAIIIKQPGDCVVAKNEQELVLRAAREIPENYLSVLDRVEVAVRPF